MQTLAVAGIQPSKVGTRGDLRLRVTQWKEELMLGQDPRWADDPRERAEDPRESDLRDRDCRDPREVFLHELELPRGYERERVFDDDREYTLRGSESRTLATVGAFRVVPGHDLRDRDARSSLR